MARFLDSLHRADLAAATLRGYRYDLRHFLRWRLDTGQALATFAELSEHDLTAYRRPPPG
jgi:site-specific recombinase XerD